MTPAQRVMKMILENHKPIDVGSGSEIKYATGEPAVPTMRAYYPEKKQEGDLFAGGGLNGVLSAQGTPGVE